MFFSKTPLRFFHCFTAAKDGKVLYRTLLRRYKTLIGAERSQKALEDKEDTVDAIRLLKALLDAKDV